ncbi:MAG: phage portal protein family protein [Petrotogales bacterium]
MMKFHIPNSKDPKKQRALVAASGGYIKKGSQTQQKYPLASTSSTPLTKNAQFAGSGANVIWTQPMFFSPLHTPQNWQVASKRKEQYQWSFISTCELTTYDGSLLSISEFYNKIPISSCITSIKTEDSVLIQNGYGDIALPDKIARRKVNKKANKIKALGIPEELNITHDHDCIVIKKEDLKCEKSKWNNKKCVSNTPSPTCEKFSCRKCIDKKYKISKVKAENIRKGDYLLVPFNTDVISSIITNEDQARYAGHLASDGWVCGNKNDTSKYKAAGFSMHVDEVDYIKPYIDRVHNSLIPNVSDHLSLKNRKHSNKLNTMVSSAKKIHTFASELVKGKSSNKRFTDQVTLLTPELQKHVLGAYVDSDGSYNKINNDIEITTYSKHLANQLMMMFYRCGILARCNKQPISKSKGTYETKNEFRYLIGVCSSESKKLEKYIFSKVNSDTVYRTKRHNKRFFWKNFVLTPVSYNKSYDYDGHVYDIREPATNTITANGVAIHQCRFYYENECKVAAGVDFYAQFPLNNFSLECKNPKVLKYYERLVKKIKLQHWLKQMGHEYFLLGDVFPFLEIECSICHGRGITEEGEKCDHPNGTIGRIVILNPDWIEVQKNVLSKDPIIALMPDDELRRIVQQREPRQIYDRLPDELIEKVSSGQPIPLSNRCVSHLKHNASSYGVYGTSLLRRLFTVLAYKTKLMTANWIVAERLILPLRVVKIGEKERPATPDDIEDVASQLSAVANDPNLTLVTHHAFDYEWIGATGKIHNINNELEYVGKEILDGLMLNQALLNGEMSSYTSAQVGVEVMLRRIESWRGTLAEWVENHIFLPVAMMQGFIDKEESKEMGETVYIYPKLKWEDLQIRDTSNKDQMLIQLHDKQLVSSKTLLENFDIDYDQEVQRLRQEQVAIGPQGQMGDMGGGMGGIPMLGGGGIGGPPPVEGGIPGGMGGMEGGMEGIGGMGGGIEGGADMGGAMGGAMGAPAGASAEASIPPGFKVQKRGGGKTQEEQETPKVGLLKLTSLEQKMYKLLMGLQIPYTKCAQYKIGLPGQQYPFVMDFAIPQLKIGIESDGAAWHESPEKKVKDMERDQKLASHGWTVMRFKEDAINNNIDQISKVIIDTIKHKKQKKKSSQSDRINKISSIDKFETESLGKIGYITGDNNVQFT